MNAALRVRLPAITCLVFTLVLALIITSNVGSAGKERKPTRTEGARIRYAIRHDVRTTWGNMKTGVAEIEVSTINRQFAGVVTQATDKRGKIVQRASVLLWRGTKRWAVLDTGSENVGCGLVNARIREELFQTSICVS
jgi:hypothetical protein